MRRLIFLAVLLMAFPAGCGDDPTVGDVSPAGTEPAPTFSVRQLWEWHDVLMDDSLHWEESLRDLAPAAGYPLVTLTWVDETSGRVVLGVNCEANVQPVRGAIKERSAVLGVPWDAIAVKATGRARPAAIGYNHLEECQPPHPAGFGGYFFRGDTEFYVYLLRPSQEAAEAVMVYQIGPVRWGEERNVFALQGDFTFTQLEDWYGRFSGDWRKRYSKGEPSEYLELVTLPGYSHEGPLNLTYAGTYPRMNRILFQIKPGSDAPAIRTALAERLTALDIPLAAVVIAVQPSQP